jgi:FkbM family methyltransferase
MEKILMITPHLSTGGLPQYLFKKAQVLSDQYDFYVIEWENITGGEFVVQRNRVENLLNKKLYTLGENKESVFDIIEEIKPNVIHFEEIPETFINQNILDKLYNNRYYNIVITTHSSFTEPKNIKYLGDKIVLPSKWLLKKFKNYFKESIPCELWEYPIEVVDYDKNEYKKLLGFDPKYKHVLHVGLFTPGKNQKEIFELAKKCLDSKIIFHFVGNQAMNFSDYWSPLMSEKPSNCVWHGECDNVSDFYKASDVFYFPSVYELNPLVLKEAVSHGLPLFIKPLETYEDTYDKFATYLSDDIIENKKLLFDFLKIKQPKIQIIHLLTESQDDRQDKSIQFISKLENENIVYTKHINKLYDDVPPKEFCSRPDQVGENPLTLENGYGVLTGRHYGCFLAHINAIKAIDCDNFDYTLIFESDANIETSVDEFIDVIYESTEILSKNKDINFVSFANNPSRVKTPLLDTNFSLTNFSQDLAHCYMIPNKDKQWYVDRIDDTPWDGYDIWLNDVFHTHKNKKRLTTNKIYSNQIEGMSLIDGINKWGDGVYDYVEIGTSDFDSLVDVLPENYKGLSIEPIKYYLDRLPNSPNNKKLNIAISDIDGDLTFYYIDPANIEEHNMPQWIRGCNSINNPHPSTERYLKENSLEHLYEKHKVETLSFRSLIQKYDISEIKLLKIDTEGHDFVIIRDMLKTNIRPEKLIFEANTLYTTEEISSIVDELKDYGYVLVHKDSQNIVMRFSEVDKYTPEDLPVLIFSTGRRLDYFTKTIRDLFNHDSKFNEKFKKVWVLDDRSSTEDKFHINKLMSSYFGDNYNMIEFNSNNPFYFVEKFNFIKKVITPEDIVLFIEDDWECHSELNLNYHIHNLKNSDWTQIAFADPLDIQENDIQKKYIIGNFYWKNPYPNHFKHPYRWDGDICHWSLGSINNWTNNPSLIKGEVFFREDFILDKNFEWDFSQKINGNQVFTQECLFRHFGTNSLINQY